MTKPLRDAVADVVGDQLVIPWPELRNRITHPRRQWELWQVLRGHSFSKLAMVNVRLLLEGLDLWTPEKFVARLWSDVDPGSHGGVCHMVHRDCAGFTVSLNDLACDTLFRRWRHFSGSAGFPIPDPTGASSPFTAYCSNSTRRRLWDKETEYGALRHDLLNFMREEVEKHPESLLLQNIDVAVGGYEMALPYLENPGEVADALDLLRLGKPEYADCSPELKQQVDHTIQIVCHPHVSLVEWDRALKRDYIGPSVWMSRLAHQLRDAANLCCNL